MRRDPTTLRFEARCAQREGETERAVASYQAHIEACEQLRFVDEAECGRWALGRLEGGETGQQRCERALAGLAELGIVDPLSDVHNHFPELASHGSVRAVQVSSGATAHARGARDAATDPWGSKLSGVAWLSRLRP